MISPLVLFFDTDQLHKIVYAALADGCGWNAEIYSAPCSGAIDSVRSFKLVAVDVIVMAMDGDEIYNFKCLRKLRRLMREQNCYVPVLAATAYAMPEERERCFNAGVDAYLSKPFTSLQLEEKVVDLIARFPKKKVV